MANFEQQNPIQYRDYVAQAPVEAMTAVGVNREQQLQQGIQKVNDYYSRVAGVDVLRDVDKNYIQNNLNSLKQGVTDKLSGDFSDQRIVNQITGAATQIYKDPLVQNAIISTAQVRAGQTEMDDARKKGENGPANDSYFSNKVNEYLQNGDPKASFNYKYEKYVDVNKHKADIIKSILPSGTSIDEAYTTNSKGQRVLSDSVIRNGFKGVKPEQIKAALRNGLSPQDFRQMELDGIYQYSNVPPEAFASQVNSHYSEIADVYKSKLDLLNNAVTTSAVEKQIVESKKADLLNQLNNLKGEYDGVTSTFASGDTDSAKAKLHTLNNINQTASAMSYGEVVSQYVGDTPQQMEKWRQDKAQDWKKWSADFQQKAQFHADDQILENEKLKILKAKEEREKKNDSSILGSIALPLSPDQLPTITPEKFTEINDGIKKEIDSEKNDFISANKLDPNSKEGKDWYAAREAAYQQKPSSLSPIELSHFQSLEPKQKEYDANVGLGAELQKKYTDNPLYKKPEDFIPKDAKSVIYTDEQGHNYQFKPQDFVKFNDLRQKYITTTTSAGATGGGFSQTLVNWQKAKQELSANEYKLLEISEAKSGEGDRIVKSYLNNYRIAVNNPHAEELKKAHTDLTNELNKRITINQSTVSGIEIANPVQKSAARNLLAGIATNADGYGGKIGNTNSEELGKLLKDNDLTISVQTSPGNRFQEPVNNLILKGIDGSTKTIPLTSQQKTDIFGSQYGQNAIQSSFAPIDEQLRKAGGFTTQLGPRPYLGKTDFQSVRNYSVQGNVVKDKSSGKYMLQLSIKDPITGAFTPNIPFPSGGLVDEAGIVKSLQGLDDAAIFQLLNNKVPTAQDLDILQKAAQKPF